MDRPLNLRLEIHMTDFQKSSDDIFVKEVIVWEVIYEGFKRKHFGISAQEAAVKYKKARLTNDVRYQECTEIALDRFRQKIDQGLFLFPHTRKGAFFMPEKE